MKIINKKQVATWNEIIIMVISTIAFAYLISGTAGNVEAAASGPGIFSTGCCPETSSGEICQELMIPDAFKCKTSLISTNCDTVDKCRKGCCYDASSGQCTLNAPKGKCEQNGGTWSDDASCNIQECKLGCCVLGDNAEHTTYNECIQISKDMNFNLNFQPLDEDGSCKSKQGLSEEGACVFAGAFGEENSCKFTTKDKCLAGGAFYKDFLCTAPELKTSCYKTKNTTCVDGKDEVYYVDTCGNIANIYDANQYDNITYWTKRIEKSQACYPESADCGNCMYTRGSICQEYRKNKDAKPSIGNYVCRNLNCINGRRHGESWCLYDYPFGEIILPQGSRNYKAVCFDGEISIQPCADFNQEICIEASDPKSGFTQAKCFYNDWRTCLNLNNEENPSVIESKCRSNPQCRMFNEFYGGVSGGVNVTNASKLARSDGEILAGFNPKFAARYQGAAGKIGEGANGIVIYCIPKYTPGFVFWDTSDTGNNYGGSSIETKYICSLGNFVCVSKQKRHCSLAEGFLSQALCVSTSGISALTSDSSCDDWQDVDNWECNIDGAHTTIKTEDLPKLLNALNERCRAIGSCGVNSNIAGEVNTNNLSGAFKITRMKIDETGEKKDIDSKGYILTQEYLGSLPKGIKKIETLEQLPKFVPVGEEAEVYENTAITPQGEAPDLEGLKKPVKEEAEEIEEEFKEWFQDVATLLGSLSSLGLLPVVTTATTTAGITTSLGMLGWSGAGGIPIGAAVTITAYAALGATAGYLLGKAIVKNQHWSPQHIQQFMEGIVSLGANIGATIALLLWATSFCATIVGCVITVVSYIILLVWNIYENCFDNEYDENRYYIMSYECGTWQPPTQGNCDLCNNDIRPCSEYRCRSLGANCHYDNANGEPGYCSATLVVFSSTITPWEDALTKGLKYVDKIGTSFGIKSLDGSDVPAYTTVEFGIETSDPAACRIDNKHTKTFSEMAVQMEIDATAETCLAGQCVNQGRFHKIALSPYVPENEYGSATLGLRQGENEFYIRCQNYAGAYNAAEIAVRVNVGEGPDLTPPNVKSAAPESGSWLKKGSNSSGLIIYVDEPSECRYSQDYDASFEEMNKTLICPTSASSSSLGKWPCHGTLTNLNVGENKFYFKCKDHPEWAERSDLQRNINSKSYEYKLNVCDRGLNITLSSLQETFVVGTLPLSVNIEAKTSGCINGGEAVCSYSFNNGIELPFYTTGKTMHKQTFTSIMEGEHNVTVSCIDKAGNSDSKTTKIKVDLDVSPPRVVKAYYEEERKLIVITDENSVCRYTTNSTLGCNFNFDSDNSTLMEGNEKIHVGYWKYIEDYFIKCRDKYNNTNLDCGIILRTYQVK